MKLLALLVRRAPNRVFFSIVLGAIAGASYALIIPLVLNALEPARAGLEKQSIGPAFFFAWEVSHYKYAAAFAIVCIFILLARTLSQVLLIRLTMNVTCDLRKDIYQCLANASIVDVERVGDARLMAVLTADVPRIINGARLFPDLLMNSVSLVAMLLFVRYLNENVFWFVMGCITFGVITYQIPVWFGQRHLTRARDHMDELHHSINGLIYGLKELKLNRQKRTAYLDEELSRIEDDIKGAEKAGRTILRVAINYGDLLSFFVIGAVSFIFVNYHAISTGELVGVIMVLLYITTPVALLLDFIPQFITANVSLKKVQALSAAMPPESYTTPHSTLPRWQRIDFHQVSYQHPARESETGFKMGPVNFSLRRGEVSFIVGGNGSGKSTLSKIITLHYPASEGNIYFDRQCLSTANIEGYRQSIYAIYSDYFLFDSLIGYQHDEHTQQQVDHYLKAFALDKKVSAENGRFSTLALSDGQKRRLALLVAFIEDKDLYLFDEWAADQDPDFKTVFYRQILPELKRSNKTVVVVSHDDRYFDVADQLLVMSDGCIERIERRIGAPVPEERTQPILLLNEQDRQTV